MKVGASVVCARRGGCSATFDELNKYFTIANMPIASSQYWNSIHGREQGQAEMDEEGKQHKGYNVYRVNGTYYIVANQGDTFEYLGELFELSPKMLRRFNDLKGSVQPKEGDVIYIEPKMARWSGEELFHTVASNQTMYDLSQMYGIRLKALVRLNKAYKGKELVEGQTIRLR